MISRRDALYTLLSAGGASVFPLGPAGQSSGIEVSAEQVMAALGAMRQRIRTLEAHFTLTSFTSVDTRVTDLFFSNGNSSIYYEPDRYRILQTVGQSRFEQRCEAGEYESRAWLPGVGATPTYRGAVPVHRAPGALLAKMIPRLPKVLRGELLRRSVEGDFRASSNGTSARVAPDLGVITELDRPQARWNWDRFIDYSDDVRLASRMILTRKNSRGGPESIQELTAIRISVNQVLSEQAFTMTLEAKYA